MCAKQAARYHSFLKCEVKTGKKESNDRTFHSLTGEEKEVHHEDCESYFQLVAGDDASFPVEHTKNKDDLFSIPYSSGTTGLPKGVMVTHGNMLADICIMLGSGTLVLTEETVLLAMRPFYHTYAQLIMLGAGLSQGCKVVSLLRFEPETFLQVMQDYKVRI